MAITVTHSKVSTIPDDADTSLIRPSDWNDDHVLVGLGTAAELDAGVPNGVATLDSLGKVPTSELPAAILGALNYQGTWNAATNTPTLTSSVGTKGYYYVVSVAGTTNLNGITDWQVGDWAVFNGSIWQKIDNTDAVTSVNGYTGTVVLNAADVGAVPYTGATGAVDLNAKTLVNVSNLGVNTTTVPTIKIRAVGDNNSGSRIAMRGYSSDANSSAIRVSKFRGTVAAPQAPISGDSLGKFELAGYGTTSADAYPQVSLEGVTTEVWGATARGAKAVVKVTPNTTITQVTALTIDQDSKATFANTVTANGVLLTGNTGTVTSVTGTSPVVSSGGNTPAISMAAATTSVNGYLTSTDWNTFNGKAPATTYITNYIPYGQGTTSPAQSSALQFNGTTLTTANDASINGLTVGKGAGSANNSTAFGLTALANNGASSYGNTAIGSQTAFSNVDGVLNTYVGYQAGYSSNANYNAFFGHYSGYSTTGGQNTFVGAVSGNAITTGYKNSILGWYNGNQGGLDIRTANNYIVLSDGDGNPRQYIDGNGNTTFNGTISPVKATTAAAPAYVKGAIYFDTTLNKLRVGGATAWETITSI